MQIPNGIDPKGAEFYDGKIVSTWDWWPKKYPFPIHVETSSRLPVLPSVINVVEDIADFDDVLDSDYEGLYEWKTDGKSSYFLLKAAPPDLEFST